MLNFTSIEKLLDNYQTFILDVWGVIHDGVNSLPGVKIFIDDLKDQNKNFYLLSNSPRPASTVYKKLDSLGIMIPPEKILTSGDFFLEFLKNSPSKSSLNLKGKAVVIGLEKNTELLNNVPIDIVNSFSDADYLIMLGYADDHIEIANYTAQLQKPLKHKLPMICINPDKIVYESSLKRYCPGYFASIYEEMGGKVHYFGKPHIAIYEYLFGKYNLSKDESIMMGDSLETDIKGAHDFGISSALLLTGIHKNDTNVANLLKLHTTKPKYILKNLVRLDDQQKIKRKGA